MGSGDPGIDNDCGVFVVDSLGVDGVDSARPRVFGRDLAWTSCIVVKRRPLLEVGGTVYGHVRCLVGLVAAVVRSGAAIVTFREGMLMPGDEGLCASNEFGLRAERGD